ncbi:MAG: phosphatase PAP2 family protein [Bacteroidaceae bacterium]|nr:phosphatase PAP2 family protein [Bacteroidaceae bacterium]
MHPLYYLVLLLLISPRLYATERQDSLYTDSIAPPHFSLRSSPLTQPSQPKQIRPIMELSYVPIPFVTAAFIVKAKKEDFRGARNNFIPEFHHQLDNYIQYAPFVLTVGLKAAGVENRNQWGRFLVSSAMSYAAMAIMINVGKYTIKEQRPDGSARNSFPSGHTATAFASATILHKEYGLTRSLWYSVAGYAVATTTGVMRVMNNRHWASDILAGAGIGIFSVDLGYFLSDLIFKDRYTLRPNKPDINNFYTSPSFFNLNVGFGLLKHDFEIDGEQIRGSRSFQTQAELAYFITQHIGAGIRFSIATPAVTYKNYNDNIGLGSICAGAYIQYPLCHRFALGGKVLLGHQTMSGFHFEDELSVKKSRSFTCGVGINAAYAYRNNIAWKVNADYDTSRVPFHATMRGKQYSGHQQLHQISLSGSMSIMF